MRPFLSLNVLCLLIVSTKPMIAQDLSFDLKNYKTADFKRHSLDFSFSTQNSNATNNFVNTDSSGVEYYGYSISTVNSYVDFNPNYKRIRLSRKRIENSNVQLNLDNTYKFSKNKIETPNSSLVSNKWESLNISFLANYSSDNYYSSESNSFYVVGAEAIIGENYSSSTNVKDTVSSVYSTNSFPVSSNLKLGHGHGRLENIEDAVEALYILNELKEKGLVSKDLKEDDVRQFADFITQIKQERFFDDRLYRQKSMTALVNKLKEMGLVDNESISMYNTIADYHYYAGFNARNVGKRLVYTIHPFVSTYNSHNLPNSMLMYSFSKGLGVDIQYNANCPISLKWQRNLFIRADYSTNSVRVRSKNALGELSPITRETASSYALSLNYSYSYYPNTRTTMMLGAYGNLSSDPKLILNYHAGLAGDVSYYLSEKLRLNVICRVSNFGSGFRRDDNSVETTRRLISDLTIGFNYALF
jgi:hypothetical protein